MDAPDVYCRHLIITRTIWYEPAREDPYTLGRVVVNVRPEEPTDGVFVLPRLFAYFQIHGDRGEYDIRIKLGHVELDDEGDETITVSAAWGPWPCEITGFEFVEARAAELPGVTFDGPGIYEFQLWIDGIDEPIGRERVLVPDEVKE